MIEFYKYMKRYLACFTTQGNTRPYLCQAKFQFQFSRLKLHNTNLIVQINEHF